MGVMPDGIGGTIGKALGMLEAIDRWENEGGTVSPNDLANNTPGVRPANEDRGSTLELTGREPVPPHSSSSSGLLGAPGVS